MATMFRKLLGALPRLGVQVLDLGPGAAVISRRGGYTATKTGANAWMVGGKRSAGPTEGWGLHRTTADGLCARHVSELLAHYDVNCVFDVGANKGQYGKQLRKQGYRGRIVSFEPAPDAFERLRKTAERDPDWRVYSCALGREESVQSMNLGWKTMNSLLGPSTYGRQRYKRFASARTTQVRIRRLDEVMDEALEGLDNPRPYLKMDTQGFDMEVFAGAGERIGECVGMQSEVAALQLYEGSPHMTEAIAAYNEAGFEVTGMYPVTREESTGRVVEFDCILARAAEAPERPASAPASSAA